MTRFTPRAHRIAALDAICPGSALALSDHLHELDPGERRYSRPKGFETQHRPRHSFHRPVILFDNVIEIFDAADFDVRFMLRIVAFDRRRVRATLFDRDRVVLNRGLLQSRCKL